MKSEELVSQQEESRKFGRLRTLDWLKGIAIIGVLAVHSAINFSTGNAGIDAALNFGRFGVQLFFLVSAFTMCYMWDARRAEPHRASKFYLRRFMRIAPLFWLATLLYVFLHRYELQVHADLTNVDIWLTSMFLHGFWPNSINRVVPGGWSIAVEMTFYALFPLIASTMGRRSSIYFIAAGIVYLANALLVRPAAIEFFSQRDAAISAQILKDFLYFNFSNQAPCFLIGCGIYHALRNGAIRSYMLELALLMILAIAVWVFLPAIDWRFALVYCTIALLTLVAIHTGLEWWPIEKIGAQSYGIYLAHPAILLGLKHLFPNSSGWIPFLLALGMTLALSYGCAWLMSKTVDKVSQRVVRKLAG